MLYAIIDVGSNTVKIAVLDEERFFSSPPVFFKAAPLNLRGKVENNRLPSYAVEELCLLLKEYEDHARRFTTAAPLCFATASLRGIENASDVLLSVQEKTGLRLNLITGEEEAYFSFLGARGTHPARSGISVDLGGGSTEILSFQRNRVLESVSLPFGCLTLYQKFFEGEKYQYDACCRFIRSFLEKGCPTLRGNSILLSGGSAKAVLKYKNVLENKSSLTVGTRQFRRVEHHFRRGDEETRQKMSQILKDRFRLIPPAVAVFSQIAQFYGKPQVFVCRSGVREGYLFHHLKEN